MVGLEFVTDDTLLVEAITNTMKAEGADKLGWLSPTPTQDGEYFFVAMQPNDQI